MTTLPHLIDALYAEGRFRNPTAVAQAIGMSLSAFQRQLKGGTFGVVPLLRLAVVTGLNPSDVLRAAKKAPVADLIERAYLARGAAIVGPLDAEFLALSPSLKRLVLQLVHEMRRDEATKLSDVPSVVDVPRRTRRRRAGRST